MIGRRAGVAGVSSRNRKQKVEQTALIIPTTSSSKCNNSCSSSSTTQPRRRSNGPSSCIYRVVCTIVFFVFVLDRPISMNFGGPTNQHKADREEISTDTTKEPASTSTIHRGLKDHTDIFVYGTNKLGTQTLPSVKQAINAGIRHIATGGHHANYMEHSVGVAWTEAAKELKLSRQDFYLQTMVVSPTNPDYKADSNIGDGEQHNSIAKQIRSSVEDSLNNLQTSYLDAVLYHNLKSKLDPIDKVIEAWKELERLVDENKIRELGLTNVHDPPFLEKIYEESRIKPTILQNRFHANRGFNVPMRTFLKQKKISWQAFWILTGNGGTVSGPVGKELAKQRGITPQQFMFAFILSLGATPLIGARKLQHVHDDLQIQKLVQEQGTEAFFAGEAGKSDRIKFAKALGRPDLIEEE